MTNANQSCGLSGDNKHALQDAEIRERLKHIKKKILVMSGKGGVGKSSIAAILSVGLAKKGHRVGLDEDELPFIREFKKMVSQIEDLSLRGTPATIVKKDHTEDNQEGEMDKVIFAIPTAGGKLCAHFGHCEQFALIETENRAIKGKTMQTPPPHEPGVLPKWLHDRGANVIITGGMGDRAQQLFDENGIMVITGAPMDSPESLVNQYLSDSLVTKDNVCDH